MRIVFMGTAELACPSLEAVASQVVGVVTQPDRPKGRELKPTPPPVKVTAQRLGLPVIQPEKIRDAVLLRDWSPDLIVVVAYGQILPRVVLELPRLGCVNVHTSLLPRWRGAAPIQYAILHGDTQTGVTTMFINEKMDAGDIILQRAEPIHPTDTSGVLHDRLAGVGAGLLTETIALVGAGRASRQRQDESQVTYAKKITKDDGRIDWSRDAAAIERQIRAFDPWPGAFTSADGQTLKIWKARIELAACGEPGTVLPQDVIATGQGGLRLIEVQPANGKRMTVEAFRRGHTLPARFE